MKALLLCVLVCLAALPVVAEDYIVIGWNDLGMHCSNKYFGTIAVLPPYNNVMAHVIRVGDSLNPPVVMTTGLRITYEIPGNTYSVGKTDFWDYENALFGVNLPPNIGLTGVGLSGEMATAGDHFHVEGIPLTPFTDADLVNEDSFQLGLLSVYDASNNLLATTQPVVPVSNEMNCVSSGCHSSEQAILNQHAGESGLDPSSTPILCASCHSSNALGAPGQPGVPSLSEAMHKHHGEVTDDCYKCHPGPNTQCLRDVMSTEFDFTCQSCHGSVTWVGESISSGREPWLEEPSCGDLACHGSNYAEEPGKLFRQSRGHGGLFCSTCHGEPHAIVPAGNARDNVQNIALQGFAGTLRDCRVCHGANPLSPGPHGLMAQIGCCSGMRGNIVGADTSGADINVADLTYFIDYMFRGGTPPLCIEEADVDGSAGLNVADLTHLIAYLFRGGPAPIACP